MSVDPLAEKYYSQSMYAYAANDPIRFIDWMRMGPGNTFPTKRAAAIDWAKTYNDTSIIFQELRKMVVVSKNQ